MPPKSFIQPRSILGEGPAEKKARKPRAPPTKPEGMSSTEWEKRKHVRQISSAERKDMKERAKLRQQQAEEEKAMVKAAAEEQAMVKAKQAAATRSALMVAPYPPHWGSQASVGSPAGFSPISPASFQESQTAARQRYSPSSEFDNGFNPNVLFPCPAPRPPSAFDVDINIPYSASSAYASPALRRGPLPFGGSSAPFDEADARNLFGGMPGALPAGMTAEAYIEDLIATGSASNHPSFFTEEQTRADAERGIESQDLADVDAEETQAEQTQPDFSETEAKGKKGKKKPETSADARLKWTVAEDTCLAEAWKTVSMDPITGANQNSDNYWRRVKAAFDERSMCDPKYRKIHMERGEKAITNHWAIIQTACSKWHSCVEEVDHTQASGENMDNKLRRALALFREDMKMEFKFHHVFEKIEHCEKWRDTRLSLSKSNDGVYNPEAPAAAASEGRPELGQKKAKLLKAAGPPAERLQASIEKWIADTRAQAEKRAEKSEERWKKLIETQGKRWPSSRPTSPKRKPASPRRSPTTPPRSVTRTSSSSWATRTRRK
uniref:Uncharacterized protein n=1 Tax=Avena sativa TaxID=4498 RepID=A0ACD5YPX6_AVESA